MKNKSLEVMSKVVAFQKYARHLEQEKRRETFEELVERSVAMHTKRHPGFSSPIEEAFQRVLGNKVLPSMRAFQFAGKPVELANNRIYNCAYLPVDAIDAFPEAMFLLLGGTGVGYSVQKHHVRQLPKVVGPTTRKRRFVVSDNIEGWADAVKVLVKAHFEGKSTPIFDCSDIRPKGSLLVTSGGKAPGPQPLQDCLYNINKLLNNARNRFLRPIEVHDIMCMIADAVLAGGIRRAAMISLFSLEDEDMLACKSGRWWESHPYRGRANNSAVIVRNRIKKEDFVTLWKRIEANKSGEPGVYFTNDPDLGTNPCCEISLKPFQFCNLTTINASDVTSQEDLNDRAYAASVIGTLQASYTDFHYLREVWRRTTEEEALIGVSMTGIASGKVLELDMAEAAEVVKKANAETAKALGINPAARTTCVKPEGTASLVLGTSSGIHAWHNDYYIRRIEVQKKEALYAYLTKKIPECVEDDLRNPTKDAYVKFPVKAPAGSITRQEPALDLLERVKKVSLEWVKTGHRDGANTNNVSATVTVKDEEWKEVGEWMWKNRTVYNGLAILPYDGGTYSQTPFEDCTKYTYDKLMKGMVDLDLREVTETTDETDLQGEIACAGGACDVSF